MSSELIQSQADYRQWLGELKTRFRQVQLKAAVAVNSAMLQFYWELGADMVDKQTQFAWGSGFVSQLSADLTREFQDAKGFSRRNLELMRQWHLFWSDAPTGQQAFALFAKQPVSPILSIPWGHNLASMAKCKQHNEALYYVQATLAHGWSRSVLVHQIESGLWQREGKAITNFAQTLPSPQSDLATQLLKDPYKFDFLSLSKEHNERELELGLIHVSLGTEAAAQLKLNRFNKETTVADNKRAIELLRNAGIVTEAQFIVGLENETRETLEETYQMARDWNPDMANWAMYTPWPFSDLFQELGDKVEVFDFEKYNFVTPIMKPEAMDRAELLDRVMSNYRRFFFNKTFFQYPWTRDKTRRKYLMGCLKAFLKSGFERKFYDLGRVGYTGPQSKKKVDFAFDSKRTFERPSQAEIAEADAGWVTMHGPKIEHKRRQGELNAALACGGGTEQMSEEEAAKV